MFFLLLFLLAGDPAADMVAGIKRYLLDATQKSRPTRRPTVDKLRFNLGVVDARVEFRSLELAGTVQQSILAETTTYRLYAIRWPVLPGMSAEGWLYQPKRGARARAILVPDAGRTMEAPAAQMASSGVEVLMLLTLDLGTQWSGNPKIGKQTQQPHREFLYRMSFPVGRHPLGYEVQKVLAAVDYCAKRSDSLPFSLWGKGEGGAVALYAAALDSRIKTVAVSEYFAERENVWQEPLYRNVWGLLKDFGDAEIASLIAPRKLLVDDSADAASTAREVARANGAAIAAGANLPAQFLASLGITAPQRTEMAAIPPESLSPRLRKTFDEMVAFTQKIVEQSEGKRSVATAPRFWDEVIGRVPVPSGPVQPAISPKYTSEKWVGSEVRFDVLPNVFGYGVLLQPKDLKPGEKRPVVVVQHGLNGRPEYQFLQTEGRNLEVYRNIAATLADLGFVVYVPQNPYIDDFRPIARLANPLGLSLYSFMYAQYGRMLDWLTTLEFVDPARIGFYGLSYGGKTALRIPPFDRRFAAVVCSGDFNEWIRKLTSVDAPYSYMFTIEYEILEWNMAHVASHAELAMLLAPIPFLVERGHRDGVGVDEWVSYEFAKVRRFYDEKGWGDRTGIAYFNGPHRIDGAESIPFLRKWLKW